MRGIDFIATAAAVGVFSYFIYKVILPKLPDLQLPFWQPPTPVQQTPQLPSTPPSSPTPPQTQQPSGPSPKEEDEEDAQKPSVPKTIVPSPPPKSNIPAPALPTGTGVVWSSRSWANGRARSISGHEEKDPDDPRVYIAAGEGRNATFDGKGTMFLSGARARLYILASNYNSQMILTYVHNSSLDNLSLRLRSHRNEGGGFGGYKLVISRDTVEAAWQTAYQGSNPKLTNGEKQLPQALPANTPITVKWMLRDNGPRIESSAWIDYGTGGFKNVINAYEAAPPAVARDKAAFLRDSIAWIRTNGGAPKDVPIKNVSITSLG